jgi:hypothetical protein
LADVNLGPEACWWNGDGCIGCQGLYGVNKTRGLAHRQIAAWLADGLYGVWALS